MWACVLIHLSHVQLFEILWTVAHQAPLSMEFSKQNILEWIAMPSSMGSSQPRERICVSYLEDRFFTTCATCEAFISYWHATHGLQMCCDVQL